VNFQSLQLPNSFGKGTPGFPPKMTFVSVDCSAKFKKQPEKICQYSVWLQQCKTPSVSPLLWLRFSGSRYFSGGCCPSGSGKGTSRITHKIVSCTGI